MNESADGIPGIDLGPYLRGEPGGLERAAARLREVSETIGFYYIENHGIPQEAIDKAFKATERFHAQSLEEKNKVKINRDNVGYLGLNGAMQKYSTVETAKKPNFNESFFCMRDRGPDHPDVLSGQLFFGMNQWPPNLPGFREDVLDYFYRMEQLGLKFLPVVATALDLPPDFFTELFKPPQVTLRMIHYPVCELGEEGQFGTGSHTDAGFLTFLAQNGVRGLQIRGPDGNWIDAPTLPGKFIVNSGDAMKKWTNDRFLSTPHRVLNASGMDRYSMAFFFSPHLHSVMECLPTCQSETNPPKYAPYTHFEYRKHFLDSNYFYRQQKAEETTGS